MFVDITSETDWAMWPWVTDWPWGKRWWGQCRNLQPEGKELVVACHDVFSIIIMKLNMGLIRDMFIIFIVDIYL